MKQHSKWITAAGVAVLSATMAFAAPHGDFGGGHRHGRMEAKLAKKLNLSDAQKQQWKDIRKASREQNKAFFEQAKATRKDFRAAKEANDQAKMDSLKATMQSQRAQFKEIRQAEMQQFVSILTPDQKAQLDALKAKWDARRAAHGNGQH